jgi:hypothetical protein
MLCRPFSCGNRNLREENTHPFRSDRLPRRSFYQRRVHVNGRQSGVSGIFDLKIDNPSSKDPIGETNTGPNEKETKLDAAFHATLK